MKILTGATTPEIAEAENRLRELENKKGHLEQTIKGIRTFLASLEVPTLEEIIKLWREKETRLEELQAEEDELRQEVRSASSGRFPTDGESMYEKLRTELISNRGEVRNLESERLDLIHQHQQKLDLKDEVEEEIRRIERHLSSKHVISTYTFSQCPRCLQEITNDMRAQEEEDLCMLCGRSFSTTENDTKAWEKTIRDAKQTIEEIGQLVDLYENRKSEISRELSALQQRIDHIEGQLSDETRRYVAPLVEQLKLASAERTQLERDLSRLEYQGKQRRYAIKLEEEALPQAEKDLEKVTLKLVELKKRIISPIDRSNAYMTHFRHFLRNVTLDLTLDSARWHEDEQVPYINGQHHR